MAGAGIISGFDMTSEAALAKLSYVLGHAGLSLEDRKKVCAIMGLWHRLKNMFVHMHVFWLLRAYLGDSGRVGVLLRMGQG
jgi:hypothetical protein